MHHNNGKIEKSVSNNVFVDGGLLPKVKSIYIDEEKLITPWRKVAGVKGNLLTIVQQDLRQTYTVLKSSDLPAKTPLL